MRLLFLLSILLSIDAEKKISVFENILLKESCGKLFNSSETNFPPWLLSVRINSTRFTGVVLSKRHIVIQANNLMKQFSCNKRWSGYSTANFKKEYSKHLKDFRVATKQCYQDQEAECEFKVPVDFAFSGWCNEKGKLEGSLFLEMKSDVVFKASPICLLSKKSNPAPRLPNDEATVYWGQFPKKPKKESKGIYNSTVTKFKPMDARYKTPVYVNNGGSVVTEQNGRAVLIGFEPGHQRDVIAWNETTNTSYRLENYMTDNLKILCNFSGICPILGLTKLTTQENIDLKSKCGKMYDPTTDKNPSWHYTVEFEIEKDKKKISSLGHGVLLSHKHIMVQTQGLLKTAECNPKENEKQVWARVLHFHQAGAFRVEKCSDCEFVKATRVKFYGKCQNVLEKSTFQGVLVLEMQRPVNTTPVCLPRKLESSAEYNLPGDVGTIFDESAGRITEEIYTRTSQSYSTYGSSIGTGRALINNFDGRAYFLGFAPTYMFKKNGSKYEMQEYSRRYLDQLCKDVGICGVDDAKTEPLLSTTPTPVVKKLKPRKKQLPFEYDEDDFIYWPEETTKTSKWKGALWVTVAITFFLS